jgi:hypothetical protein
MSLWICTEDRFLADVAGHKLTVLRDDRQYRHLRFSKPNTCIQSFDLVTWPGLLCYTGDMGAYVFRRTPDMFEFFRSRRNQNGGLRINPGYWSEKLDAVDASDGVRQYDEEVFRSAIREQLKEWIREGITEDRLTRSQRRELCEFVESEVMGAASNGEDAARAAASEFSCLIGSQRYEFSDFWERTITSYVGRFIWCCYAIVWGIEQYDARKS